METHAKMAFLLAGILMSGAAPVRADVELGTAAAACQGALPAFEGALRKRPLGISNEGDRPAFVTCALQQRSFEAGDGLLVWFTNRSATAAAINCTLVSNIGMGGYTARYVTQRLILAPGQGYNVSWWHDAALDGTNGFRAPSVSCALPPDTELNVLEFLLRPY